MIFRCRSWNICLFWYLGTIVAPWRFEGNSSNHCDASRYVVGGLYFVLVVLSNQMISGITWTQWYKSQQIIDHWLVTTLYEYRLPWKHIHTTRYEQRYYGLLWLVIFFLNFHLPSEFSNTGTLWLKIWLCVYCTNLCTFGLSASEASENFGCFLCDL